MAEHIRNTFYGGMADSIREGSPFKFEVSKHFDIFSDPKRLIPYKTIVANNSGVATTNQIANFLVIQNAAGSNCVALGKVTSTNRPKLFLNSGADAAWEAMTNAESAGSNSTHPKMFIYYKGKYYGRGSVGTRIWSYNLTTTTYTDDASGGTLTLDNAKDTLTNAIIGKSNGYMYFATGNLLHYFDGTNWGTTLLTIPSDENIIGLANYGSYLAVMTDKSYIYLWDFAKALADEIVELEDGSYSVLGSIGGVLVAVGQKTTPVGSEIVMSQYAGGTPDVFFRKILPSTVSIVRGIVRQRYGKLYFAVNDSTTGRPYQGIWAVGRRKGGYPFAVTIAFDYIENSGTASDIVNFDLDYSYLFIVSADYLIHKLSTTYATANPISYMETGKFVANQDSSLKVCSLNYDSLPSAGAVTLKYRKDAETSWTTIFTDTTDGSTGKITDMIETPAVIPLPSYGEIEFRLESLGGAQITEFKFKDAENQTIYDIE